MAVYQMIPPQNGTYSTISVAGRTYASTAGLAIPVPDFDAPVLLANGWKYLPVPQFLNASTVTGTSGVLDTYHFQGIINPSTNSTAVTPVVEGEAFYPVGAQPITGGGTLSESSAVSPILIQRILLF